MEQRLAVLDIQLDNKEAIVKSLNVHIDSLNTSHNATLEETRAELDRYKEHGKNLEVIVGQIRETYQSEIDKQNAHMARMEQDRTSKDQHIRYLEKLLQGIESGRVMRLTRTLSRFLGRH